MIQVLILVNLSIRGKGGKGAEGGGRGERRRMSMKKELVFFILFYSFCSFFFFFLGHRSTVTSLDVHPVYSQVASSSEDATVKLWDYESGEFERSLKGHTGFFSFLLSFRFWLLLLFFFSFSFVDLFLIFLSFFFFFFLDVVQCVSYSPSGHMIASCSADLTVKLWETDSYNCVKTLKGFFSFFFSFLSIYSIFPFSLLS